MKKIALFLSSLLVACASAPRVEQQAVQKPPQNSALSKFDQVKLGLPASEVVKLLGTPTRTYKAGDDTKANYWMFSDITVKLDEKSNVAAKGIEALDKNITLAALENRYGVKDLELVKTVVGCSGPEEKLGADIYRSKELGAEIAVSFTGDIQRFVQNDELKQQPASINSQPVCRLKR